MVSTTGVGIAGVGGVFGRRFVCVTAVVVAATRSCNHGESRQCSKGA